MRNRANVGSPAQRILLLGLPPVESPEHTAKLCPGWGSPFVDIVHTQIIILEFDDHDNNNNNNNGSTDAVPHPDPV
jgi:hypothetical protein